LKRLCSELNRRNNSTKMERVVWILRKLAFASAISGG